MPEQKPYRLLIQKGKREIPDGIIRNFYFAIMESDKKYPNAFVCNFPKDPENLAHNKKSRPITPFPEDPTEFCVELLVDAFYKSENDLEIQNEIIRRLCLIWKENFQ